MNYNKKDIKEDARGDRAIIVHEHDGRLIAYSPSASYVSRLSA